MRLHFALVIESLLAHGALVALVVWVHYIHVRVEVTAILDDLQAQRTLQRLVPVCMMLLQRLLILIRCLAQRTDHIVCKKMGIIGDILTSCLSPAAATHCCCDFLPHAPIMTSWSDTPSGRTDRSIHPLSFWLPFSRLIRVYAVYACTTNSNWCTIPGNPEEITD